jgi:hypothetical protein
MIAAVSKSMNVLITGLLSALAYGMAVASTGQAANEGPAIDVSAPNRLLPIKAADACRGDFKNIRVFGENSGWTARLKSGKYERKLDSGYEAVSLDNVFCLKPGNGKARRAVIVLNWLDCGGSCTNIGVVQLFEVRAAHPVIKQQFVFDSHAAGTGAAFDEKSLSLTITARSDDGSPNCCAKNFDVVTYQWQGTKFVQQNYKRVPALPQRIDGDDKPRSLR